VLHASKSPVVVHCLGAKVVLNFTPKGGYKGAAKSTAPDKDKVRAEGEDRTGSLPIEPRGQPSRHLEQDNVNQTSFIPGSDETPIAAENVDEAIAAMDNVRQCCSHDACGITIPNSNTSHFGHGMEMAHHEVVERCVHRKNEVTIGKNKASVPEISVTLVHGDCVVLSGDDFEVSLRRH
jgi:hypothetical protein